MTSDRIKEIQDKTAFPDSISVCQALLQVWNECEQERVAFVEGYTQCQEDMADKKYTEEDLLHAFREGVLLPNSQIGIMEDIFKQVVHSLNNKQD